MDYRPSGPRRGCGAGRDRGCDHTSALTNEALFEQREEYLRSAEKNSEKAYDMSRAQYDVGQTDLLSVLQIQAKWIGARVGVVNIAANRLIQRVDLHLALGGSFEVAAE